MGIPLGDVLFVVAIGIGATLFMDLWNLLLHRLFGIASLNFCLLGRWVAHLGEGRIWHADIRRAAPKRVECSLGWIVHYTIGVTFALTFVALTSGGWLVQPTILPALGFGGVTVVFPLLIMQPAMGFGIGGSRTPSPAKARFKSLGTHMVFGIGLYLTALGLSYSSQAYQP